MNKQCRQLLAATAAVFLLDGSSQAEAPDFLWRQPAFVQPYTTVSRSGVLGIADSETCFLVRSADGLLTHTVPGPCLEAVASPDGRFVALLTSYRGYPTGGVYETSSWTEVIRLGLNVGAPMFSPNGRFFLLNAYPPETRVFDVETWQLVRTFDAEAVSVSPDSQLVALHDSRAPFSVRLARLEDGKDVTPPSGFPPGTSYLLGNDWLALFGDDAINIYTISEPPEVLATLAVPSVQSVAVSPDASVLAALYNGGEGGPSVQLWQTEDFSPLRAWPIGSAPGMGRIGFVSDDALVTSVSDSARIDLWRAADGQLLRPINTDQGIYTPLVFTPDGSAVVGGFGPYGNVRSWAADDGSPLGVIEGVGRVVSLAFSPDGQYLVGGGDRVLVWSWPDGVLQGSVDERTIEIAVSSRDVVAQRTEDKVRLLSLPDLAELRVIRRSGPIDFSPDGSLIVVGDQLFDVESGALVQSFVISGRVVVAAFAPDGDSVVLGEGEPGEILDRFAVPGGQRLARFGSDYFSSLSFSPDGATLAEFSFLYSVHFGRPPARLQFWDGYGTLYREYGDDLGGGGGYARYSPIGPEVAVSLSHWTVQAGNVFGVVLDPTRTSGPNR